MPLSFAGWWVRHLQMAIPTDCGRNDKEHMCTMYWEHTEKNPLSLPWGGQEEFPEEVMLELRLIG